MTVHEPVVVNDSVFPETVQLSAAVNETVSPEVLLAERISGPGIGWLAIALKVIV